MDPIKEKRFKWLILFLLGIRIKDNSYELPVEFRLDDIKTDLFGDSEEKKLSQLKKDLKEISITELQEMGGYPCKTIGGIRYKKNGAIELVGMRTENLFRYIPKRLTGGKCLFGLSTIGKHKMALTFVDEETKIKISGKPYLIFCYLTKHPNEIVSYKVLYRELRKSIPYDPDYWSKYYDHDESKKWSL